MHVHATVFFSKVHPACHNIVNRIKPGTDSRKTDKHAVDCICNMRVINFMLS